MASTGSTAPFRLPGEVKEELLVNEFKTAVGCGGCDGRGKTVDELLKNEVVFHTASGCGMRRVAEPRPTVYHTC
jgi:hypothetical protein